MPECASHGPRKTDRGMELRQLRAFLQVSIARHFGRAAAVLKITQPALTQRIQALERELGVQLFTRSAREVRLTASGETLLPYARSMVQVEDRALRELADSAAGRAGRLRVAYLSHGDVVTQGTIVAEFRRRYPSVEVETSTAHSRMNIERLREGEVDCAFVALPVAIPDSVAVHPVGRYQLVLALPRQHRLALLERVPVKELRDQPLIMLSSQLNPVLTSALGRWLTRRTGLAPNIVAEEPPDQAVEAVASSGRRWRWSAGGSPQRAPEGISSTGRLRPRRWWTSRSSTRATIRRPCWPTCSRSSTRSGLRALARSPRTASSFKQAKR